jgi:glycosyltransferase involved in cell wall biosynthesis
VKKNTVAAVPDMTAGEGPPRHVLVVAPQPFYEDRGTPIAVRQVLKALSHLGYEVDVLTYPVGRSLQIPGVRYFRVANPLGIRTVPIGFSVRKLWLDVFLFFALRKLLRRHRYYCIHAVEEAAFLALLAARRPRIPIIYDMQSSIPEQLAEQPVLGSSPMRAITQAGERWVIRRATRIVCSAGLAPRVKAIAADACVREWRFPGSMSARSAAHPDKLRARLKIRPDQKVVLYTGNFQDYQGTAILVEAMPKVLARVPNAVFVLVGADGPARARVERRLADHVCTSAHRLVERLPRESIHEFLSIADVAVSPRTHGSNLPLKALEYLSAGLAIVATSIPAHRAVLNDKLAILAEPTSDALATAIARLLESPEMAAELRAAARRYAEENLNWLGFVGSVSELYEGLEAHG